MTFRRLRFAIVYNIARWLRVPIDFDLRFMIAMLDDAQNAVRVARQATEPHE